MDRRLDTDPDGSNFEKVAYDSDADGMDLRLEFVQLRFKVFRIMRLS